MRNLTILHGTISGKDLVRAQVLLLTVCLMLYRESSASGFLHGFSTDDFFKVFWWIHKH